MKKLISFLFLLISAAMYAQTGPTYSTTTDAKVYGKGSFGKGDNTPTDPSAILELGKLGTDKGLLLPRITDTAAVVSPKAGLLVYVPADEALAYFDGFRWQYVTKGTGIISVSRGNDTLYFELANGITVPVKMDYYTTEQLQTPGQASVHWSNVDNITDAEANGEVKGISTFRSDHFDDDGLGAISLDTANGPYYTKTQAAGLFIPLSQKAAANGVASLDAAGKVPLSQINDALLGAVIYQGTYNASTNTPALPTAASGNKGWYYVVSVAGTQQSLSLNPGDWIISNGSSWGKVDNNNAVTSVFGRTGAVTAQSGDYTTTQVTEGANLYFNNTRARSALSAGTGISYSSGTGVITNSAPDQTVSLINGTGISVTGTYPNFTITNTGVTSTPTLQQVLTAGNTATNSITLGAAGNTNFYDYKTVRSISSVNYTSQFGTTAGLAGSALIGISNGAVAQDKLLYVPHSGTAPVYSPDGGTSTYSVWHANNHPAGSAFTPTLTGANVLSTFTTNSAGHVTALTTRALTASDISAAPVSGSGNYIQNQTGAIQSAAFRINGTSSLVGTSNTLLQLGQTGATTTNVAGIAIDAVDGTFTGLDYFQLLQSQDGNALLRNNNSGGSLTFSTGSPSSVDMRILPGGNIGIGTGSPTDKLHVNGVARIDGEVHTTIINNNDNAGAVQLYGGTTAGNRGGQIILYGGTHSFSPGYINFFTGTGTGLQTARMTIDNAGNVGIGSTSPTSKLDVNGYSIIGTTGSERLSTRFNAIGFNRDVTNGNIFSSSGHAYQWSHTASTTNTSDLLGLSVYNTTGGAVTTSAFVINGLGNIGLGGSPTSKLDVTSGVVTGDALYSHSGNDLVLYAQGGAGLYAYSGSAITTNMMHFDGGLLGIGVNPNSVFGGAGNVRLQAAGNIGCTDAFIVTAGTTIGELGLAGSDVFVRSTSNHNLLFETNSTERGRIRNTGEWGIGKTPAVGKALDVGGAGNFDGSLSIGGGAANITGLGNATFPQLTVTGNTIFSANGTPGAGKVPTGTDASGNWTWQTQGTGAVFRSITAIQTGTYTVGASDYTVLVNPSSGGLTLTIPTAASSANRVLVLRNLHATNSMNLNQTVVGYGGNFTVLPNATSYMIHSNGTNWYQITN